MKRLRCRVLGHQWALLRSRQGWPVAIYCVKCRTVRRTYY